MTCSKIERLLSAYIDRELNPQEQQLIRKHLAFCAECQREYQGLLQTKELLNTLEEVELPEDFQLALPINTTVLPRKGTLWAVHKLFFPVAASLTLILVGGIFYFSLPLSDSNEVNGNYLISEHLVYSSQQPLADNCTLSLALGKQHGNLIEEESHD